MKPDTNQTNPIYNQESEETLVRESVVNTDQTVQTTLVTEPVEESEGTENKIKNETVAPAEGNKKGGAWKKVTIGGLTGIALGTAGAYGKEVMGEWANEEVIEEPDNGNTLPPTTEDEIAEQSGTISAENEEPVQEPTPAPQPVNETVEQPTTGFHVATSVHDNMTFGQAFAAARAEVGPGGIFEFEGQIYSTYYENEWDSMSSADKMEYNGRLNAYLRGELPSETVATTTVETTVTDDSAQQTMPGELHVLGVETDSETGATLIHANLDGHSALFVDNPNTPELDYMGVDLNGDTVYSENEIYELGQTGVTAADLLENTSFENFDANDQPITYE